MFVYFVCVYVSACLYEYIRVNVFHGEKVTFILLECFQITYWCRGCVGEAVERAKAVPACRLFGALVQGTDSKKSDKHTAL